MLSWHPFVIPLVVFSLLHLICGEIFTSSNDLEKLLKTQETVMNDIQDYISNEMLRIAKLERTLKEYQNEHEKAMKDVPDYLGNPINLYRLIKRLTVDLDTFENVLENGTEYIRNKTAKHPDLLFPNTIDLSGAVKTMGFLTQTYDLNITEMSEGKLTTDVYSSQMSSDDCFEMARILFIQDEHRLALPWFLEALRKYSNGDQGYGLTEFSIVKHIILSLMFNDEFESAARWLSVLHEKVPNEVKSEVMGKFMLEAKSQARDRLVKTGDDEVLNATVKADYSKVSCLFGALCRGKIKFVPEYVKRLTCWYSSKYHPFLKLAPIKVEQLHIEPPVFVFHQVVSDDEIEHLKELARAKLERAMVNNGTKYAPTEERITKIAWLPDGASPVVARITQRVADMTGLSMDNAEDLQMANYGFAGHYVPHYDSSSLSEVEQGGATVFMHLRLTVRPIKNAALYWTNLEADGGVAQLSKHAACPVLKGAKWSANKWVRFQDQVFNQPWPTTVAPYRPEGSCGCQK